MKHKNLWDSAKAELKGKFMTLNAPIRKEETFQINNSSSHLKNLKKVK